MRLINSSLEHVYSSNLVPNHDLIRFIRFVLRFTVHLCNAIFFPTTFNTPCKRFINFLKFWSLKLNTALFQICPISNLFASNKMCQYFFLFHLFVHVTSASGAGQRALRGSLVTIQNPPGNPRIQLHLPERPLRNPPGSRPSAAGPRGQLRHSGGGISKFSSQE